jgi:3D (Asp-Asp-Asp) domain-containing protein
VTALKRASIGAAVLFALAWNAEAQEACGDFWVTGYASSQFSGRTADGTPTRGAEWSIVAAHPHIPFGTIVEIEGIGALRVADRGQLGWSHLDVLVYSPSEAYNLTGTYRACLR